ncbi:hypothetical protein [Aurantiacibacter aquimixticola]|uniref:Uncharacterized protein n=1 Tax=Aurantiacibacter aquimixticola TaxID=1958945 RepID=A0A419RQP2_9SPHN|nr:hypothetical protein [Aurantiacibacter aquimixticola]RJY08113.1 hypothetical protein D6201_00930 [Aurantiacibacter aquimixticola]
MLDNNYVQGSSFCFRREALLFPSWFDTVHAGDQGIFLLVSQHGAIRFDPRVMSGYRIHANSISCGPRSKQRRAREFLVDRDVFARFEGIPGPIEAQRIAVHAKLADEPVKAGEANPAIAFHAKRARDYALRKLFDTGMLSRVDERLVALNERALTHPPEHATEVREPGPSGLGRRRRVRR